MNQNLPDLVHGAPSIGETILTSNKKSAEPYTGSKLIENGAGCFDCENPCETIIGEVCGAEDKTKDAEYEWRLCHEAAMANQAYVKFIRGQQETPLVEFPPEENEMSLRLAQSVNLSSIPNDIITPDVLEKVNSGILDDNYLRKLYELLGLKDMIVKTEPLVKEPPVPKFPLTRETKKKHIEKETVLKKEEKREAILMLEKKQEELRKLKDQLKKQTEKQLCHKEERLAEYERKKLQYLENLAKERNVDFNVLKKHGDEIYKTYRKKCRQIEDMKEKKLEEEINIILKLLREEKLKEEKTKSERQTGLYPRKGTQYWEQKMFENAMIQGVEGRAYRTGSTFVEEEEKEIYHKIRSVKTRSARREHSKRSTKIASLALSTKKSEEKAKPSAEKESKKETKKESKKEEVRHEKPVLRRRVSQIVARRFSHYKLPKKVTVEISSRRIQCSMAWMKEIQDLMAESDKKMDLAPNYKDDQDVGVSPRAITFHDFFPTQTHHQGVKLYNRTNHKIYCGLWNIITEPFQSKRIIEVWPPEIIKLWPGECSSVEVTFNPIVWGSADVITGKIWYWTRHHKGEKRKILIEVKCLRASSKPIVVTNKIDFPDVDWWNAERYTKNIIIENRGALACTVYIHRTLEAPPKPVVSSPPATVTNHSREAETKSIKSRAKKKKKSPKQHHKEDTLLLTEPVLIDYEEDHLAYIKDLLDVVLEEAYSPFRIYMTRGRQMKGYSTMGIPIKFFPQKLENGEIYVEDRIKISFEGYDASLIKEEMVTLCGSLKQAPVEVTPLTIDMSVLLVGGGMRQRSFVVKNTTDKFLDVHIALPPELSSHFQCFPTVTKLRPRSESAVILRANLGFSFFDDAEKFICRNTDLLEFNLILQPECYAPIDVLVLATLSQLLGIVLSPSEIDFGMVNTCHTKTINIWAYNTSMIPQDIAFLNLPKWGLIMPENGYAQIGPLGKRKFEFMYSPSHTEAGKLGGQADHSFSIKVTTAHALARMQDMKMLDVEEKVTPITEDNLRDVHGYRENKKRQTADIESTEEDMMNDEGLYEEASEEKDADDDRFSFLFRQLSDYPIAHTPADREAKPVRSALKRPRSKSVRTSIESSKSRSSHHGKTAKSRFSTSAETEEEHSEEPFLQDLPAPAWTDLYASIHCQAIVVDPICQLSHQMIVLPTTPVNSFSMTKLHLSCPSKLGGPSCDCGVFKGLEHEPRAKVKARFEMICSDLFLQFEPSAGVISYNEKLTIYIYFKPELSEEELKIEEELYKKEIKRHKDKIKKKMSRESFGLKKSKEHERHSPTVKGEKMKDIDTWNKLRMETLKNIQSKYNQTRIQCLIETRMIEEPFTSRTEVLDCIVTCPVIKPDFFVKISKNEPIINFSPTAVGLKKEEHLEIHNISGKIIYLTRNLLDTEETFYTTMVPNTTSALPRGAGKGIMLEPEECLNMKVIFSPRSAGMMTEFLEFKSNLTSVQIKLSGEARLPSYKITPSSGIYTMVSYPGQKTECKFLVTNTGDIPLIFNAMSSDERESFNFWFDHPDVRNLLYHKNSLPKETEQNSSTSPIVPDEALYKAMDTLFSPSQNSSPIQIEVNKISIQPGEKFEFKTKFHPPLSSMVKKGENSDNLETKTAPETTPMDIKLPLVTWNTSGYDPSLPNAYAKTILLTLGSRDIVASWTFLGFLKRKKHGKSRLRATKDVRGTKSPLSTVSSQISED